MEIQTMGNNKENQKDYEVGYKRPPREHQFKPGQSGNPKGRPKKNKNFVEDVKGEMNELIHIQEQGKLKKITKQKALAKRIVADALSGKTSIIKLLLPILSDKNFEIKDFEEDLSQEDQAILEDYIKRSLNHE